MEHLIHGARGLHAAGFPDHLGRNTRNRDIVGDWFDDHRPRRYAGAVADLNIAEDFGAGPDHNALANLRMAVTVLVSGAAQRHAVQQRDIVLDDRGLTDHEPGGMVDKDSTADFCRRMYVGLEHRRRTTLQIERKILAVFSPQPVGKAMGLDRVKALEIQHGLDKSRGRRIAIVSRHDIGPEGIDDLGRVRKSIEEGLQNGGAAHDRMIEPVAEAVHHRARQGGMLKQRSVDERSELRLLPHDGLGLAANARPDGIDTLDRRYSLRLGHCGPPATRVSVFECSTNRKPLPGAPPPDRAPTLPSPACGWGESP